MHRLREYAERTPPRRQRYVDLVRAVAILIVVLGHWMVVVVVVTSGARGVDGFSALEVLLWGRAITWLVQVMPVFFIVGGFANAASLTSHTSGGGGVVDWLLDRSARLVRPTTVLLVTLAAAALVARLAGVDPAQVGRAVWLASIPLWFLLVYLVVVFLTPLMHRLHRQAGLLVPLVLMGLLAVGDVSLAFDAAGAATGELPVRLAGGAPDRLRLAGRDAAGPAEGGRAAAGGRCGGGDATHSGRPVPDQHGWCCCCATPGSGGCNDSARGWP
jgi:hypothetical protein